MQGLSRREETPGVFFVHSVRVLCLRCAFCAFGAQPPRDFLFACFRTARGFAPFHGMSAGPCFGENQLLSFERANRETAQPKTTAAVIPAEHAVSPPVSMPRGPEESTASLTPLARL